MSSYSDLVPVVVYVVFVVPPESNYDRWLTVGQPAQVAMATPVSPARHV